MSRISNMWPDCTSLILSHLELDEISAFGRPPFRYPPPMQRTFMVLVLLISLGMARETWAEDAATKGQVLKVLPLLLNLQGHDALSPSLFDRDAYQAFLVQHTNDISALRFDVQWKATRSPDEKIKIAIELRGIGTNSVPKLETLETNVVPGKYRQWTAIPLAGGDYRNVGTVVAWRVRLWNDSQLLGEQKSFLW